MVTGDLQVGHCVNTKDTIMSALQFLLRITNLVIIILHSKQLYLLAF